MLTPQKRGIVRTLLIFVGIILISIRIFQEILREIENSNDAPEYFSRNILLICSQKARRLAIDTEEKTQKEAAAYELEHPGKKGKEHSLRSSLCFDDYDVTNCTIISCICNNFNYTIISNIVIVSFDP